ncbi:SDR family oxidoreductase [Rhizobiaceae bacterium n13]|uniref:SDR family oxidoreductase n=1 Tax=Ferirhizobium litorale TaxID=2927786 RepID=A0AAE3U6G5_9HYPH|nr:SDR family oxidoreductase [Fererhizobium litorale]MDI7864914.1 SDR family oxidoreductase [Fererhizobium litorale]MDI7925034.1 SDR family oxidoreductase [Fererhizobium litorale]
MKIVIIGGSGLIGTKVAEHLRAGGHSVLQASPSTGTNSLTGEGLPEALAGADVVVDVANSPSFEPAAVLDFFRRSTTNILKAETDAGVRHHVALSIVGMERSPDNGYFKGKLAQEALIKDGGVPYTIVRSTQFLEFIGAIADSASDGQIVRVSSGAFQPIAADDVASFVAEAAVAPPLNGSFDIAGPQKKPMSDFVSHYLAVAGDARKVVADPAAEYFGSLVDDKSLVPLATFKRGAIDFETWLSSRSLQKA